MKHFKLRLAFAIILSLIVWSTISFLICYFYANGIKFKYLWITLIVTTFVIDAAVSLHIFNSKRCSDETKAFWLFVCIIFLFIGPIFYLFLGQKKQKGYSKGTNSQTILLSAIFQAKKSIKIYTDNFYPSYDTIKALNYAAWKKVNIEVILTFNVKKGKQRKQEYNIKHSFDPGIDFYYTNRRITDCFIIFDDKKVLINNANFNYKNMYSEAKFYKTENIDSFKHTWTEHFKKTSKITVGNEKDYWFKRLKYGIINIFYPFF